MNSMTGYGSASNKNRRLELEVHVKSVNGRFLEVRFHLPKEYAPFENGWRRKFQSWSRGTVDVYVHRRPTSMTRLEGVRLNQDSARHWIRELNSLSRGLGLRHDLSLSQILQLPLVMEQHDRIALLKGEMATVERLLIQATDRCSRMRGSEGRVLKGELTRLLGDLDARVLSMDQWRDEAMRGSHQRLQSRISALQTEHLDASRLALETALLIDKMDVREEMVRLREHIKACSKLMAAREPVGKKLDFYCQELLREVNTIGSKSQLASLTASVVEAKSLIEKFREQVQNIE